MPLAMHLPKEFKTFLLKMTPKVLESFGTSDFDFNSLEYFDITKKIQKDVSRPDEASTLCCIV
jgi:hypothetical protein